MTKPRDVVKQREMKLLLISKYGHRCELCGFRDHVDIHHIDWNRDNNTEENTILLCPNCHSRVRNTRIPSKYTRLIETETFLNCIKGRVH